MMTIKSMTMTYDDNSEYDDDDDNDIWWQLREWQLQMHNNQPIIGIGWLVRWYWATVVYTVGKYKFLFLLP